MQFPVKVQPRKYIFHIMFYRFLKNSRKWESAARNAYNTNAFNYFMCPFVNGASKSAIKDSFYKDSGTRFYS